MYPLRGMIGGTVPHPQGGAPLTPELVLCCPFRAETPDRLCGRPGCDFHHPKHELLVLAAALGYRM